MPWSKRLPGLVRQLGRQLAPEGPARGGAHHQLAHQRSPPASRHSVPAVAGQERHGGEHHEALHELGPALRQREAHHTPVVHHERDALEPERVHEPLEEVGVAVDRVVELGRLGGVAEPRQVGRDTAAQLEERDPVEGRGRYAVEIQHGRVARLAPVHLELPDPLAAFDDLHRAVFLPGPSLAAVPKRPDRRRLIAIRDRLRREYGRPRLHPHHRPVDELVLTVLSQNTNDRNRDVAYGRLRERFPSWEEVRRAPVARGRGRDPARRAGSDQGGQDRAHPRRDRRGGRSARLRLAGLAASTPRSRRRGTTSARSRGSGRKTAACVLLFSFGRHDVPVDTHVFRVGTRLGLFRPGASLDEAHDEMLRLCPRGRRLRGSRAADPARQAYLRRACPALRRVPAEAHVPGGQAPAASGPQSILRRSTTKMSVSLGPMGPDPCAP